MTTILTFKKETIEYAVDRIIEYSAYYAQVEEDQYDFAHVLKQALTYSASDDIQMSLDDFVKIKKYIQ